VLKRLGLLVQFVEQRLCVLEIGGVETFGEPAVDFGEHRARLITPALFREQPSKARRSTQFRYSGTLPPGDFDRGAETPLRCDAVRWILRKQQFTFDVMQQRTVHLLPGLRDGSESVLQHLKSFLAFELVKHALDRFPMLEAQALRTLWMTRYEEAWAHLQPGMRKGNPRAIEVGMKVAERAAKLAGLDTPAKIALTDAEGGIPLETIRRVMERVDRQMAEVDVTPSKPAQIEGPDDDSA